MIFLATLLLLLGAGCMPQPLKAPPAKNAYPGTEPYVSPTSPPPGR